MSDLATLLALRDELINNRGRGTRAMESASGDRVEYRTDAELAAALADIERRIAAVTSPVSTVTIKARKGWT